LTAVPTQQSVAMADGALLDFFGDKGVPPSAWEAELSATGVWVLVALGILFVGTLAVALRQCYRRLSSVRALDSLSMSVALSAAMRVLYLMDPYGWLRILPAPLRAVLYVTPQAMLATSLAYLVALWSARSWAAQRLERVGTRWSLGPCRAPVAALAVLLVAAACVKGVLYSDAIPEIAAQSVLLCSVVRGVYLAASTTLTALVAVLARRFLILLPPAAAVDSRDADGRAWWWRRQPRLQGSQVTYARPGRGLPRCPVLFRERATEAELGAVVRRAEHSVPLPAPEVVQYASGVPAAVGTVVLEPAADGTRRAPGGARYAIYFSQARDRSIAATLRLRVGISCAIVATVVLAWTSVFLWCMALQFITPLQWLLFRVMEHAVELVTAWVVLAVTWPPERRRTETPAEEEHAYGIKEGSDAHFDAPDWKPSGRGRGLAALKVLPLPLKEVWEDDTIRGHVAEAGGGRRRSTGRGEQLGLARTFFTNFFRAPPAAPAPRPEAGQSTPAPAGEYEIVMLEGQTVLPLSAVHGTEGMSPGTVLEFSLDALLATPALRALLVEAQARQLHLCEADQAALVSATARALQATAQEAIDALATGGERTVENPLRNLPAAPEPPSAAPDSPSPDDVDGLPASFLQWLINEWPDKAQPGVAPAAPRPAVAPRRPPPPSRAEPSLPPAERKSVVVLPPPVRPPSPPDLSPDQREEGSFLFDALLWAHACDRKRRQEEADLAPPAPVREEGGEAVVVAGRAGVWREGLRRRGGGGRAAPLPLEQELPSLPVPPPPWAAEEGGDEPNPFQALAAAMRAREEERRGGSRGTFSSSEEDAEEELRRTRVVQTLANLRSRGRTLPPKADKVLQTAQEAAHARAYGVGAV